MGDREAAAHAAEERLALARELEDAKSESGALGLQAVLAEERGDLARAEEILATRLELSRARGDAGRPERRGTEYAEFLLRQGRHGEAGGLLEECLAGARARGDTFLVGRCTAELGWLALIEGRHAEALAHLTEGVRLLAGLGERYGTVFCIPLIAEVLAERGSAEKSARLVGASVAQLEESELALWAVGVRRREASIAKLREALGEARFAELYAEGEAMSFDEVVEYALDPRA
jgi:tetratricopeptide (TPR) repeat protein